MRWAMPWEQFWQLPPASFEQARMPVDIVPLVFVAGVTGATIRRIPASYSLYLVGLLLICLSSPVVGALFPEAFVSVGRYLLAAIPVYLLLGRLTHHYLWLDTLFVGGGFALQALLMAFVLTGGACAMCLLTIAEHLGHPYPTHHSGERQRRRG